MAEQCYSDETCNFWLINKLKHESLNLRIEKQCLRNSYLDNYTIFKGNTINSRLLMWTFIPSLFFKISLNLNHNDFFKLSYFRVPYFHLLFSCLQQQSCSFGTFLIPFLWFFCVNIVFSMGEVPVGFRSHGCIHITHYLLQF